MTKKLSLILLSAILLTGCASVDKQPTENDVNEPNDTVLEETTESDEEVKNIKPALEELHTRADEVIKSGPESEVTEEEFNQRVEALISELETMLQSDSYRGDEFLDGALTDLLNVSPERHEGMGAESYEEHFELVSPIALSLVEWQGMINTI